MIVCVRSGLSQYYIMHSKFLLEVGPEPCSGLSQYYIMHIHIEGTGTDDRRRCTLSLSIDSV